MKHFLLVAALGWGAATAHAQTKPAARKPAKTVEKAPGKPEAQESPAPQVKEPAEGEMKLYYLAFLKKGPNRSHDSLTSVKIQEAHMAHINKMAADGKLTLAGPFMDDGEFRGIFIFNVATMEEAKALTEADPAVKAGRLVVELHPWFAQKGAKLK
ncbi:YciI family protein [Rufibacter sediminis]|uniref:YciI family protein n=1 Tax=Rufibacter sediminis TaxID=2762756 RepID=UPI00293B92EC|nr:YciI family protein [Rufibacter sediminis]